MPSINLKLRALACRPLFALLNLLAATPNPRFTPRPLRSAAWWLDEGPAVRVKPASLVKLQQPIYSVIQFVFVVGEIKLYLFPI